MASNLDMQTRSTGSGDKLAYLSLGYMGSLDRLSFGALFGRSRVYTSVSMDFKLGLHLIWEQKVHSDHISTPLCYDKIDGFEEVAFTIACSNLGRNVSVQSSKPRGWS